MPRSLLYTKAQAVVEAFDNSGDDPEALERAINTLRNELANIDFHLNLLNDIRPDRETDVPGS